MTFSPNDDDRLWKEPQQEGWFHFSSPLRYIIFLLLLVILIITLWYLYSSANRNDNKIELTLIKTDETPFKIKAEDQGVPNISHQDKLVYGRIRSDQNTPVVEHILPDPHPPLTQNKDDESNDASPMKMVEQYVPQDLELEKPTELPTRITSIEELIEELPEKKLGLAEKGIQGSIFIQLASLKSQDMAESEWERLSKNHKDILEGLEPTIQKVDLGADQGIYYRLRTGPFENAEEAKKTCTNLKGRKVGCLVIQ